MYVCVCVCIAHIRLCMFVYVCTDRHFRRGARSASRSKYKEDLLPDPAELIRQENDIVSEYECVKINKYLM